MMKDKLVKYNHKGGYYRLRKFFLASLLLASISTAVVVPTYVSVSAKEDAEAQQQNSSSSDQTVEDVGDATLSFE